jgi:5-hydroxyisourate hydrolase-like protein (transthyretin family)
LAAANGKPPTFKRDQKVNFWMQVYNLSVSQQTHKPKATIEYNVINAATNQAVLHKMESTDEMGNVGDQLTLEKSLSASALPPGVYRLSIKVNDTLSKQTVDPTVTFAVE